MIPKIALVGRSNVGKSTLFNLLTRTKDALVDNLPGLTRDRKYGYTKIKGREFICIDTGGINITKEGIENHITEQSLLAIKEADIVFFIVDAHTGLMQKDSEIAKYLYSIKKLTLLIANKIDGINIDLYQTISCFLSLGFNRVHPISAFHGRGINYLLKTVLLPLLDNINSQRELDKNTKYSTKFKVKKVDQRELKENFNFTDLSIKIAIVGRPNVGKSMLINRILGKDRVVVYDVPGTTRDSVYIPTQRGKYKYILIDTAGVRKRNKVTNMFEKFCVIKSFKAIKDSNVVILVIDAKENISDQDLSLLRFILDSGRSLVIVVNKYDVLNQKAKKKIKEMLDCYLNFINFAKIHFISALYDRGIDDMLESVHEAYKSSIYRVSASVLTNIMSVAVKDHPPPLIHGRLIKFKYAHSGGYNPTVIVIHGNQVKNLPDTYKKYLVNYFHKALNIMGTPIHIRFKDGKNPYINN